LKRAARIFRQPPSEGTPIERVWPKRGSPRPFGHRAPRSAEAPAPAPTTAARKCSRGLEAKHSPASPHQRWRIV